MADITPKETPVSRAISVAERAGAVCKNSSTRARCGVVFTGSDGGVSGRVNTGCSGGGSNASGVLSINRITEPKGANVQRDTCFKKCRISAVSGGASASMVTGFNFSLASVLVSATASISPHTWREPSGICTILPTGAVAAGPAR